MDQSNIESFREKLDQTYSWPALYMFKFIVPSEKKEELKALFPNHSVTERPSSKGTYISVTIEMMLPSSQAVIDVYVRAYTVKGILSL